jgi:predicted DNA-binding ribbon-helix-helix protein
MTKRPLGKSLNRHRTVYLPRKTKITIEDPFWKALKDIAAGRNRNVNHLVRQVNERRPANLSSATRLFVLDYDRKRAR